MSESLNTFKDLYNFLKSQHTILDWIQKPWIGKDKQESLLRLFAGLGLISKLSKYQPCKGNYNLNTISKHTTKRDIFYNNKGDLIYLKDKGDSSDLTCISEENQKHLLVTTSKNINTMQVGKLDIDKLLVNFEKYKQLGYSMSLCVCVRNCDDLLKMTNRIENTNNDLREYLNKEDTIIIDWNDLDEAFHQFKINYSNKSIDNIIDSNKSSLVLKMHQRLGVLKTLRMKDCNKKKILWGHIQRSGKSYIIGGCIINDSIGKSKCNYLIITTAPNETIRQQKEVFNCLQLNDFKVIELNGKNIKPKLADKNIIICSKQFLQTKIEKGHDKNKHNVLKVNSIKWLKNLPIDIRFIDESHNGGTTELAQKTLEYYGKDTFTVQITATYSKPINDYNIPKENWILWDLEDIKNCKNINNQKCMERLIEKHGIEITEIIDKYSKNNIISEYSKYPELHILTEDIKPDIKSKIINRTKNNNYGWSLEACFLPKQTVTNDGNNLLMENELQNEEANLKLWYRIFGKTDNFDIPDDEYPNDRVFMKKIERICKNPKTKSRFIGEKEFKKEPMIIMAFLPQNNIDIISKATKKLLEENNVIPHYDIISINSKTTKDPKQTIEDARIIARNNKKKGVLVLSGKQCSLGVSINNCDIVLLLNNNMAYDMIYQMMFRCMTEAKNKTCGFVVDLNIHRVVSTITSYASIVKPEIHAKEAIKHIFQERLINLNSDQWMSKASNYDSKIVELSNSVYNIYLSDAETSLNNLLNRIRLKNASIPSEDQKLLNVMFKIKATKQNKEIEVLSEDQIKKGIEKIKTATSNDKDDKEDKDDKDDKDEKEDSHVNYMDILVHIIPLVSLLTIDYAENNFIDMYNIIEKDEYIYNILIEQTRTLGAKNINSNIFKKIICIYKKCMENDAELNQMIKTVKELFVENINNSKELSKLIDKHFIPQELERKNNAEVSTPYVLRQDMLDTIPLSFWKSKKKVFEPCAGKGGFIIDIIDRFMEGLKDIIPDKETRYKEIVEDCIYFNDINLTNIFICKLLINPDKKYNINYNQGDTLELDIKTKWSIDNFDAIIGNPPYNKGKNANYYVPFMNFSYNNLSDNGYNLFVIPNRFLIPKHKANQCLNLFQVKYIVHTVEDFDVSTDIGYYLAIKQQNINNENVLCKFKNNNERLINLSIPTPTANNTIEYKSLSDKILKSADKINFIKEKKEKMEIGKYIFIPRHWTRFCYSKPKGGKHIFNITDEYGDDGRFIEINNNKENIVWYLSRSKVIRFITNNYASTVFIPPFIWESIPKIDFTKKYTDDDLYDLFELTEDEKRLINKVVD